MNRFVFISLPSVKQALSASAAFIRLKSKYRVGAQSMPIWGTEMSICVLPTT